MRKVKRTITLELAVDDRITDAEVTEDLEKLLASEQARQLLQEPSPTRYGGAYADRGHTWWLESARIVDVQAVFTALAVRWEHQAARNHAAAETARQLRNEKLAVPKTEAAHWLGSCAKKLRAALASLEGQQ